MGGVDILITFCLATIDKIINIIDKITAVINIISKDMEDGKRMDILFKCNSV